MYKLDAHCKKYSIKNMYFKTTETKSPYSEDLL